MGTSQKIAGDKVWEEIDRDTSMLCSTEGCEGTIIICPMGAARNNIIGVCTGCHKMFALVKKDKIVEK